MYLSNCISCLPPGTPAFWPHLAGDAVAGLMKKGQTYNISEILHPNLGTTTHHYSTPVFTYGVSPGAVSPISPSSSGLAPLQALCASGVSAFVTRGTEESRVHRDNATSNQLKFGISRILSEEFGKNKGDKALSPKRSPPRSPARGSLCPCSSISCTPGHYPQLVYPSSLSAVHALQPPQYPMVAGGTDSLPGELFSWPYSILSADSGTSGQPKRKRSWSRAVFSNLQRKGLEKRFEVQKYVTKPDRRQLAAMLGLTDAQVKVWFQNRRMKWRHAQQQKSKEGEENDPDVDTGSKEEDAAEVMEEGEGEPVEIDGDSDEEIDHCEKEEEIYIDRGVDETEPTCTPVNPDDVIN